MKIWHNYYELMMPIYCSGKPGQKGNLKVKIGTESTTLKLNIIHKKDRFMKGDFHGIKNDEEMDPETIGYYEPDEKIIYVCRNHPILRHYRSGKGAEKNITYKLLYSDVIIREFCKALSRKKVPSHENMDAEEFRVRFDKQYDKLYKKHSIRLHKFCINPKNIEMIKAD